MSFQDGFSSGARVLAANPNVIPRAQPTFEKELIRLCESRPLTLKQRVRNLLIKMFKGHEEFLGWTPD